MFQCGLLVAEVGCKFEVLVLHCVPFLPVCLVQLLFQFDYFGWHLGVLQMHAGAHLVHRIDGFVGEEAVCYVSVCQFDTCRDGIIGVRNVVMRLVTVLYVVQNLQGLVYRGRFDHDLLEASFQCAIFLYGVPILV